VRSHWLWRSASGLVGVFLLSWGLWGVLGSLIVGATTGRWATGYIVLTTTVATTGVILFRKGLREERRRQRLRREGIPTEAAVTGVRETNFGGRQRFSRMWVIDYQYIDRNGKTHKGQSGYVESEEALTWKPGDSGKARFDPQDPSDSVWIGRS